MGSMKVVLHPSNWPLSSTGSVTNYTIGSTGTPLVTQPLRTENLDNLAVMAKWAPGTPTGTFFLDASANYVADLQNQQNQAGDWVSSNSSGSWSLTNGAQSSTSIFQAAGSTGIFTINLNQIPYPYLRMRYVASTASSSGVLNIWVAGKQL